jgi:acyl-CoA thioesterase-1
MRRALPLALLVLASACSVRDAACGKPAPETARPVAPEPVAGSQSDPQAAGAFTIAFLGDSLTAGLGLMSEQAFPALLERKLLDAGYENVEVVNAGVSGDTTAGGLRRVEQLLGLSPKILVVALGGNDALRGLTVKETRDNLRQIIDTAHMYGAIVMLCGIQAPTNLGSDYRDAFNQVYFELLREYQRQIVYVPFLLEGVAGNPALNQADGIHPNAEGSKIIADLLYPQLKDMVDRAGGGE